MNRAPTPIFPKARALYLNKYPLDQIDNSSKLRLFIQEELVEERVESDHLEANPTENSNGTFIVLLIKPIRFALVHWQEPEAASPGLVKRYLNQSWGLENQGLQPKQTPWFLVQKCGHQSLLDAPLELRWDRKTPFAAL